MTPLSIEEFGRALITTGDLDPLYIALYKAQMPSDQLKRWLLAYWCFYHAGVASFLAESEGRRYWDLMSRAAANVPLDIKVDWPRGTERRHFRGKLAVSSVEALIGRYKNPEDMVDYLTGRLERWSPGMTVTIQDNKINYVIEEPYSTIHKRVITHRGFGPWIAFKVADMLDRCAGVRVAFEDATPFMFDDPAKAVDMLWVTRIGPITPEKVDAKARREQVVDYLINEFSLLQAPPAMDRKINIQEVETVLCKWKSHVNGHYPVGKDSREIAHHLEGWGDLARALAQHLPEAAP